MSSLASAVSLLVAISDLKLVTSITKAINADLPKDGPLGTIRPSNAQLYARPRQYFSPTPAFRPVLRQLVPTRPVHGYSDQYVAACDRPVLCANPPVDPCAADLHDPAFDLATSISPFEPPWRHLPPVREERVVIKVQRAYRLVELSNKGQLLDIFI